MDIYWIWLSQIKYVGPIIQKSLLTYFGNPYYVFQASETELANVPGINKRAITSIVESKSLKTAEKIVDETKRKGISLIRYGDPFYVRHAMDCPESPILLYYKGRLTVAENGIAVVGSRRCTLYGKRVAREIGGELAEIRAPLISGFAKGIDSYAQEACVQNRGYTIGILGNGVDICYPKEQRALYERIIDSGGVFLSSYAPGTLPRPAFFLQRNALISAFSKEVIIVEAAEKSGALWTAEYARKHGRKVYAVPHEIGIPEGKGVNMLLEKGNASPYLGIKSLDVTKNQSIQPQPPQQHPQQENEILTLVSNSPKSFTEIATYLKVSKNELLQELLTLELNGKLVIRGNTVFKA